MSEKDNLGEDLNKTMWTSKKFRMILIGLILVTATGIGMAWIFPESASGVFNTYCVAVTSLVLGYVGVEGTSDAMIKKKIAEKRGDALVARTSPFPPPDPLAEDTMAIPIQTGIHQIHRASPPPLRGA